MKLEKAEMNSSPLFTCSIITILSYIASNTAWKSWITLLRPSFFEYHKSIISHSQIWLFKELLIFLRFHTFNFTIILIFNIRNFYPIISFRPFLPCELNFWAKRGNIIVSIKFIMVHLIFFNKKDHLQITRLFTLI